MEFNVIMIIEPGDSRAVGPPTSPSLEGFQCSLCDCFWLMEDCGSLDHTTELVVKHYLTEHPLSLVKELE